MNSVLLIVYSFISLSVGKIVSKKLYEEGPLFLRATSWFLLGTLFTVSFTYLASILFTKTDEPLLYGLLATMFFGGFVYILNVKKKKHSSQFQNNISISDILLVSFALCFALWLMSKTLRGSGELLFVGSNTVFDFGNSLGIVRSFSWGKNIPITSPHEFDLPFFYHFFFYFWVAIWEYLGISLSLAMNIPSILSFVAMLIVVYYLPQLIAKQKSIVGWIAVFLTVTNSSLTFWQVFSKKGLSLQSLRDLWVLPTYPFAGPYDGSTISIFVTLNNYVNQRHLAFSVAVGWLLYLLTVKLLEKKIAHPIIFILLGIIIGFLFLWNMAIFVLAFFCIFLLLAFWRQWKSLTFFLLVTIAITFFINLPFLSYIPSIISFWGKIAPVEAGSLTSNVQSWSGIEYLWKNLGILPGMAILGFVLLPQKLRRSIMPLMIFFAGECILALVGKRGFDQKFYSFLIIGINMLASIGIFGIWEKRSFFMKSIALLVFLALTFSGVIDLMPIKNEFAFPFISEDNQHVISWIHTNTAKSAVFVSYADIIDPVVLAGRKNFFGFFGNIGRQDRSDIVSWVYKGNKVLANEKDIDYVLLPKWTNNDFLYEYDISSLRSIYRQVYEDNRYIIFAVE